MCLTILKGTRKRIAKNDILVYKCLDYDSEYGYCTPFQYIRILFNSGRCEINVNNFTYGYYYNRGVCKRCVEAGIHSYHDKTRADETSESFVDGCGTKTHYAVIPKGAKYYIGDDGDIVSTKLIIFETEDDYYKYVEENNGEKICKIGEKSLSLQEI